MTYQPQPTKAVPTGMHQVIPNRNPSIVGVRHAFDDAFGGYVPPDWTWDAECTRPGTDPEWFYPGKGGHAVDKALSICARCEVVEKCLEDTLAFEMGFMGAEDVRPECHGVAGGKTAHQRLAIIRERRAAELAKKKPAVLADIAQREETGRAINEIARAHGVPYATVRSWISPKRSHTKKGAA